MTKPPRTLVATTLREVAEVAGVSIAAVSKVLHGKGKNIRVSDARAEVIRETARKLRYQPNALARSLRMSRTHTVGLIWENMQEIGDGPLYYVHLLDGVATELFRKHYRLTILPEIPHNSTISSLSDGRLDGIIWCKMPDTPAVREELNHHALSVVGLNSPPFSDQLCPTVSCDNAHGSKLVVDHLVALGHRHIVFPMDHGSEETPDAIARLEGFQQAMAKHGLSTDGSVIQVNKQAPDIASVLKQRPEITAVFAWYEGLAGRIMASAQEAGYSVPGDLSVVGFDSTLYCDSLSPRLTAVKQPIKEMAQMATRILLDQIEGHPLERNTCIFPCTLDVRESTSPPASNGGHLSQRRGSSQ